LAASAGLAASVDLAAGCPLGEKPPQARLNCEAISANVTIA
jgi:hypothetical protein